MTKAPKVGTRVRFKGGLSVGPCTGTVTRIYPAYRWDEDLEKETWDPLPENKWSVEMQVDEIPEKWPYAYGPCGGKFAPEVSEIVRIRR